MRTVEFGLQHGDEAPVVRQAGQRIADRHRPNLFEQTRLFQQRAAENDHVASGLAQFGNEERAIEKVSRKSCGSVANYVKRRYTEK